MRRADYLALAEVIALQMRVAAVMRAKCKPGESQSWENGAEATARGIAEDFAARAQLGARQGAEFLRLAGVPKE